LLLKEVTFYILLRNKSFREMYVCNENLV